LNLSGSRQGTVADSSFTVMELCFCKLLEIYWPAERRGRTYLIINDTFNYTVDFCQFSIDYFT